jgi:hypothetical protein
MRYAFNLLDGLHAEYPVLIFDYHFAGYCSGNKGQLSVQHYYCSAFLLEMKTPFLALTIAGEKWGSRLVEALAKPDISFESAEFSRAFSVHSTDKKFAYDVCNPQMMEYLLVNRDLTIEINRTALAIIFETWLRPPEVEKNLSRLIQIRKLLPDYLFT